MVHLWSGIGCWEGGPLPASLRQSQKPQMLLAARSIKELLCDTSAWKPSLIVLGAPRTFALTFVGVTDPAMM